MTTISDFSPSFDLRASWRRWIGALLLSGLAACSATQHAAEGSTAGNAVAAAAWDEWSEAFLEGYLELHPSFAVRVGRHDFDGQMADLSASGLRARVNALRDWRREARAIDPAALDPDRRFERDLTIWYLGRSLFWLTETNWRTHNPMLNAGSFSPSAYLTRDYAPLATRREGLKRLLDGMPLALEQIQGQLADAIPVSFLRRSMGYYGGLARHLKQTVPALFGTVGSPAEQAALKESLAAAVEALEAFKAQLERRLPTATADFALGAEGFARMLAQREAVTDSLRSLKAQGQVDLHRNLRALNDVCTNALQSPSLADCMARVDADKSLDPVGRGRAQLPALKAFVQARDLVTIPSDEAALVAEAPPYRRANLAYISLPGAFETGSLPSIYYISPPDPAWSEAEQRAFVPNEGRLLYVSVHEVWPGHFLWGLHRNRAARPLVRLFTSTTFSEGWAHYVEELMHDEGLGEGDPALHVGQLLNALKRNVRYLCAIGLHAEGMSQEAAEQRFLEEALLDPGNARQQAARGTYDPSYYSYTLGKLQILRLRDDWRAANPDASLKAFHDRLLSYGGAPVSLIRRYMLPSS